MSTLLTQKTSDISTALMTYLEKLFLTRLTKNLVLQPMGKHKSLDKGQGKTIDFRRWSNLSDISGTEISEGVSPDGQALTLNSVNATLAQYGGFVTVSDILSKTAINDVLTDAGELIAYQAALSLDSVVRNELDQNLTIKYAASTDTGGSNSSEANVVSNTSRLRSNEVRRAYTILADADVPEYDGGMYRAVLRPLSMGDLMAETAAGTFMEAVKYTSSDQVIKGRVGKSLYGFELFQSSNIRAVTTSAYLNLFFGKDAFGVIDVAGSGKPEIIVHPQGSSGTEDPLNQRGTVGWKAYTVAKVLEAARGISYACYSA